MGGSQSQEGRAPVLLKLKAKYTGSVPVKVSDGQEVADAAFERVDVLVQDPQKMTIHVSADGIMMEDARGDMLKEIDLNDVPFVAQRDGKPAEFCFFEVDEGHHLKSCHCFSLGKKDASMFGEAVNQASLTREQLDEEAVASAAPGRQDSIIAERKGGLKRSSSVKFWSVDDSKDAKGDLLHTFDGTFYGKLPVTKETGDDVCDQAKNAVLQDPNQQPGTLQVYESVIELWNGFTNEAYHTSPLLNYTYGKHYPDLDILVYILADEKADTLDAWVVGVPTQPEEAPSYTRLLDSLKTDAEAAASTINAERGTSRKAAKKRVEKRRGSVKSKFDVFEGSLLGPVMCNNGVSQEAANKCVKAAEDYGMEPLGVLVQLGQERIRIFDGFLHHVEASYASSQVLFSTLAGAKKENVCITAEDALLGTHQVYIIKCTDAARAEKMLAAMSSIGIVGKDGASKKKKKGKGKGKGKKKAGAQSAASDGSDATYGFGEGPGDAEETFDGFGGGGGGGGGDDDDDEDDPFEGVGERLRAPGNLFKRQIRRGTLKAIKEVGAGQFGAVWLAKMDTSQTETPNGVIDCAVKMLKDIKSDADRDEFVHEAEVMLETAHTNVMGMIGVAVQQKPWLMCLDFMRYGDLQALLKAAPSKGIVLALQEQLTLCLQCAEGMAYLESIGFAHCDLAARNVLVGDNNNCKVADFGLTRRLRHRKFWKGPSMMKIPIRWSAIEVMQERRFSLKSDVWAYGILGWEIFAYGQTPYPTIRNAEVLRMLTSGGRLAATKNMPKKVYEIFKSCWKPKPDDRPTFVSISISLSQKLQQIDHGLALVRDTGDLIKNSKGTAAASSPTAAAGGGKAEDDYYYCSPR